MAALRLLLTLAPLSWALTSEPAPPFQNLRLEPDLLHLSWDGYVTSGPRDVACQNGAKSPELPPPSPPPRKPPTRSRFTSLPRCHVTDLCVFRLRDPRARAESGSPSQVRPGPRVHALRLHWPTGALLGCRVDGVAALPDQVTVTVTGGGGVSCSDISLQLQRVEILTPPTLTAACNGTEAAQLRWEMRSHFHSSFVYELLFQKSSHSEPEIQEAPPPSPADVNPGSTHFRVRAKPMSSLQFSTWSPAVPLDCNPAAAATGNRMTVMAAALVALGAGLAGLVTLLLCRRPLMAKLFPAILQVAWVSAPEDSKVTPMTKA